MSVLVKAAKQQTHVLCEPNETHLVCWLVMCTLSTAKHYSQEPELALRVSSLPCPQLLLSVTFPILRCSGQPAATEAHLPVCLQ